MATLNGANLARVWDKMKQYVSSKIGEIPKPNWLATDSESAAYIQNKPKVLTDYKEFSGVSVPAGNFTQVSGNSTYPYRAAVTLAGVTSSMIPEVCFSLAQAATGNFSTVAETYNGGLYIFAKERPASTTVIPTITCKGSAI